MWRLYDVQDGLRQKRDEQSSHVGSGVCPQDARAASCVHVCSWARETPLRFLTCRSLFVPLWGNAGEGGRGEGEKIRA